MLLNKCDFFAFRAFLSFGGVYLITAGRKENDEDEREAEEVQSLLPSELRYLFFVYLLLVTKGFCCIFSY